MSDDPFKRARDRTRLDRLQGKILAFVSTFERDGYSNMDIARELAAAAFERCRREPNVSVSESFHQHIRDSCVRYLARIESLDAEFADKFFVQGH
jgi:hypothetical protein